MPLEIQNKNMSLKIFDGAEQLTIEPKKINLKFSFRGPQGKKGDDGSGTLPEPEQESVVVATAKAQDIDPLSTVFDVDENPILYVYVDGGGITNQTLALSWVNGLMVQAIRTFVYNLEIWTVTINLQYDIDDNFVGKDQTITKN